MLNKSENFLFCKYAIKNPYHLMYLTGKTTLIIEIVWALVHAKHDRIIIK